MRTLLLVTIAALPLAACDIEKTSKDDKTVTFNASDNGSVAFQVPGMKGNINLPGTMMAHGDMDIDGVKLFPDSRVGNVNVNNQDVKIGFKSPATVATVKDYYTREFAEKGVTVTANGDTFVGTTKDGDAFTLTLADSGGATAGKMQIHDKE